MTILKKFKCCQCEVVYGEEILKGVSDGLLTKFAKRDGFVLSHGYCDNCFTKVVGGLK